MDIVHEILHELDLIRFVPVGRIDGEIKGRKCVCFLFTCPKCKKIESVFYWYDEPLIYKRWWQHI